MPRRRPGGGLRVIIAGAGGAAHLPGMLAAKTRVPVLGVPVESRALAGLDSLLSIVQMPKGVPVGTLAIGPAGAANAALLAAAMIATTDAALAGRLDAWRLAQTEAVAEAVAETPADAPPGPAMPDQALPPGSTIGILGGGQLGRMLAIAAARLGLRCHVFEPGAAPAGDVARLTTAGYDDPVALGAFAGSIDVATFEFENVPAAALDAIEGIVPIRPGRRALAVSQDRLDEKAFLAGLGIAVADHAPVDSREALDAAHRPDRPRHPEDAAARL